MKRINRLVVSILTLPAFLALAGCLGTATQSMVGQRSGSEVVGKAIPRVQDCGVLNIGTPSRFVCDGKVYTSFQLAKLREDEAKKYAAGK